jgi:hypothetical protein
LIEAAFLDYQAVHGGTTTSNIASAAQLAPTRLNSISVDLAAGTADYQITGLVQQAIAAQQSAPSNFGGGLQATVQQLLINMANLDTPLPALTVGAALNLLIDEMVAAAAFINQGTLPAVGAQTNATWVTPVGNPTFVWSAKDAAGRGLQYTFPETVTALITQDAQSGATAGQEPYTLTGQNANGNPFAFDWLGAAYGSGAQQTGNLIDPSISNTGSAAGNLTVNGTFGTFTTTDQADNWNYVVGVATTNFANSTATTTYYTAATGIGSLKLISDGTNKNDVRQKFNTASATGVGLGGTPYLPVAAGVNNTQYMLFVAYKMSNASPTNGTLTVDICDSAGTTVVDDQATANSLAINLTTVADTNWHIATATFRLPQNLGTNVPYLLRFRFTGTILDSGKSVYLGAVGLAIATQLYAGGPFFVGFRGSINPNASGTYADAWTFGITNTPGKLQRAMWRWINPVAAGPQTPGFIVPAITSGSATIADTLVA